MSLAILRTAKLTSKCGCPAEKCTESSPLRPTAPTTSQRDSTPPTKPLTTKKSKKEVKLEELLI